MMLLDSLDCRSLLAKAIYSHPGLYTHPAWLPYRTGNVVYDDWLWVRPSELLSIVPAPPGPSEPLRGPCPRECAHSVDWVPLPEASQNVDSKAHKYKAVASLPACPSPQPGSERLPSPAKLGFRLGPSLHLLALPLPPRGRLRLHLRPFLAPVEGLGLASHLPFLPKARIGPVSPWV